MLFTPTRELGSRDSAPPLSGAARDEACKERNRLLLDLLAIEQRLLKKKQSSWRWRFREVNRRGTMPSLHWTKAHRPATQRPFRGWHARGTREEGPLSGDGLPPSPTGQFRLASPGKNIAAGRKYFPNGSPKGGSDAGIIIGDDEAALQRLWQEKRGDS